MGRERRFPGRWPGRGLLRGDRVSGTYDDLWDDPRSDPFAEPDRRLSPLWRWLPLVIAVVAFELTTDPMIAGAVACLKFGWEEILTSIWLLRTDPQRARGRACALFHAAYGFGKMSLGGFAVGMLGVVLIWAILMAGGGQPRGLMRQSLGAWLVLVVAALVFLILAYAALLRAMICGVAVWLGREAHRARKLGEWPPVEAPGAVYGLRSNRLRGVVIAVAILSAILPFLLGLFLPFWPMGGNREWAAVVGFWVTLLVMARAAGFVRERVVAASPRACWPETSLLEANASR